MSNNNPEPLSINELLQKGQYLIPIYQRNYAWGQSEIRQLIQDIFDYSQNTSTKGTPYYIGSLIVSQRANGMYETIDGQQRLTTLVLLIAWYANNYPDNGKDIKELLSFESRPTSTATLQALYNGSPIRENHSKEILDAYHSIEGLLHSVIIDGEGSAKPPNEKEAIKAFYDYLYKHVIILHIEVPKDTDLNHYFEIMNNRGEQLEKHEILKARCLEAIDPKYHPAFTKIWEACANMNRYIQDAFPNPQDKQKPIFDNNYWLTAQNIEQVMDYIKENDKNTHSENKSQSLQDILAGKASHTEATKDTTGDKFESVINFPNFLIHVLRLQVGADVPLDDKRLLETFDKFLLNVIGKDTEKEKRVLTFGYNILKYKFLFDTYIIKQDMGTTNSEWRLQHYKKSENNTYLTSTFSDDESGANNHINMLLSMFHVSFTPQIYKHWLTGALKYVHGVYNGTNINAPDYLQYLENLARAFLLDNFLAKERQSYFDIIYTNNGIPQHNIHDIQRDILDFGTNVPHYIFNYLDYLLWKRNKQDFKFTVRNSIEHWHPQNQSYISNPQIPNEILHSFGNLCLITRGQNSRYSNHAPTEKAAKYQSTERSTSIKHRKMVAITEQNKTWGEKQIVEHGEEMKAILLPEE